jgi:hypothetical protein
MAWLPFFGAAEGPRSDKDSESERFLGDDSDLRYSYKADNESEGFGGVLMLVIGEVDMQPEYNGGIDTMAEGIISLFQSTNEAYKPSAVVVGGLADRSKPDVLGYMQLLLGGSRAAEALLSDMPKPAPAESPEGAVLGVQRILCEALAALGSGSWSPGIFRDIKPIIAYRFMKRLPLHCTLIVDARGRGGEESALTLGDFAALNTLSCLMEQLEHVYPFGVRLSLLVDCSELTSGGVALGGQQGYVGELRRWVQREDRSRTFEVCDIESYRSSDFIRVWKELTAELTAGYFAGDQGVVAMVDTFLSEQVTSEDVEECLVDFDPSANEARIRTQIAHLAHAQTGEWLGVLDLSIPGALWRLPQALVAE